MPKISEGTLRLMAMRDSIDRSFTGETYYLVELSAVRDEQYQLAANLALIGGRLDAIIRRNLAHERKNQLTRTEQ